MSDTRIIAVTGGTGFVGQAVLDIIAERGLSARALARKLPTDRKGVEWISGSLEDREALDILVAGTGAVIHIAGLTNTPDPAQFAVANVAGTQNVLDAAAAADIRRLVFVSSLSAREPQLSHYGASKERAEQLVAASGRDWTMVRPPAVYGPRDTDMFELFKAARLGVMPMPPKGATSVIHVRDLAGLLVDLVPSSPVVKGQVFEPDDGREGGWSHRELALAIGAAMGRKPFVPHLPKAALSVAARVDRLIRGDGAKLTPDRVGYMAHPNWVSRSDRSVPAHVWQPQISTPDGLKSTARWYRTQGWL